VKREVLQFKTAALFSSFFGTGLKGKIKTQKKAFKTLNDNNY